MLIVCGTIRNRLTRQGDAMVHTRIITLRQTGLTTLMAIYTYGSRIQGTVWLRCRLDLAVLVADYAVPIRL